MRIVIDMQGAQSGSRFRGIGRYTMSFTRAVVRNRGKHEIILALNGLLPDAVEHLRAAFAGLLPQENIRVWHAPATVRESQNGNDYHRKAAELIREAFLASLHADVIHISSLFEGYVDDALTSISTFDRDTPVSVVLYDLIPLLNPDHYLKPNPTYQSYYLRKVEHLKKASMYLAISEFSRQEGIDNLKLAPEHVTNIAAAIEPCFYFQEFDAPSSRQLKEKFGITRPFVLYSGASDERKNLPRLIEAYAALPAELRVTHQLLLAGGMTEQHQELFRSVAKSAALKPNELLFTGHISDIELAQLYSLCRLFVFPSWHEGFGLPALEAMACGAPVIGANTSSLPDVIGMDEALFDPFDTAAISQKMSEALEDEAFRTRLSEHGLRQCKKFSWDATAKRAIAAWEALPHRPAEHGDDLHRSDVYPRLIDALAKQYATADEASLSALAACLALNGGSGSERQLLVDISELVQHDAKSGIQRVVRSILKEWILNPPNGYRVEPVYATTVQGYRYARKFTQRFLGINDEPVTDEPIDYALGDFFFGLDLQPFVVAAQRAFFQALRRQGVRVQFVVYDLLCVQLPEHFPDGAADNIISWLEVVTENDGAICISKAVADDLAAWVKQNGSVRQRPFIIDWFHLGADVDNSAPTKGLPVDADNVLECLRSRCSFLMVGTVEPRKGHAQTLGAFEQLWKSSMDVNLVIVGKQGWMTEPLVERLRSHPELNKRLFWLEGISDEYLEKVYAASSCLIAASYGEGFGLPLIEAAQHKLPIMARDIRVFREVAGGHAYYFDDDRSPQVIAEAVDAWLALYKTDRHPKSDTMPWLTWKESAEQLTRILLANTNL